jgi:hypothetical protein
LTFIAKRKEKRCGRKSEPEKRKKSEGRKWGGRQAGETKSDKEKKAITKGRDRVYSEDVT